MKSFLKFFIALMAITCLLIAGCKKESGNNDIAATVYIDDEDDEAAAVGTTSAAVTRSTTATTTTTAAAVETTAVEEETAEEAGQPALSGTVTVSPSGNASTGTKLTATYSGTETVRFQWRRGNRNVNGANTNEFTPTEPGRYSVSVSARGFRRLTGAEVLVTTPLSGDVTISPRQNVQADTLLTASYSGTEEVSFQWRNGNQNIAGATSAEFTPTEAGRYFVTVGANGYTSKTSSEVRVSGSSRRGGEGGRRNTGEEE